MPHKGNDLFTHDHTSSRDGSFFFTMDGMIKSRRNLNRLAVAVSFFLSGLLFSSWAVRIPAIKDRFHFNDAQLGGVLFMLPLGSFVALPFAGWAVHRFGSRLMTPLAAITYSLLLFALSQCQSPITLSVGLFFFGFWGDFLNISMNTQGIAVQGLFDKPLLSSFHAMWSVGALAGAVLGGASFKMDMTTVQHMSGITIFTALLAIGFSRHMVSDRHLSEGSGPLFAWPDKALLILGSICFCCTLCEGAMADWSSLYYRQVAGEGSSAGTTGYTAFTFAMSFGRFSGDRLIQHFRNRKVLMADGLLIAVGLGLALWVQLPFAVIIGYAAVGFGVATVIPIVYTVAARSGTMAPAIALAAVSTIGFTGFLIGPPIIGFIAHAIGLRMALLLVVMLGICIWMLSRQTVGKH